MAIITKEINGRKYLYEVIAYRENGKVKHKWISLGRINNNNDLIVSKKNRRKAFANAPGEVILKTIETKYVVRPIKCLQDGEQV
ncbi:MAG: hypothetical protein IJ859_11885 [Synergistaceae bacterium]|nr:hypothetical protein [Synergistaceae bacterium]